jgi:hypothetical protein
VINIPFGRMTGSRARVGLFNNELNRNKMREVMLECYELTGQGREKI